MFKRTAPLFQKWLYFGLSTIFSSVMLGIMSEISMDLIGNISVALFTSNEAMELLTGDSASGVMYSITQQLGLGLMLSTLLIVVPPMAGMWFNGVMASYSGYNAMQGWGTGQPATPPGHNAPVTQNQVHQPIAHNQTQYQQPVPTYTIGGYGNTTPSIDPNTVKPHGSSTMGVAGSGTLRPLNHQPIPSKVDENKEE